MKMISMCYVRLLKVIDCQKTDYYAAPVSRKWSKSFLEKKQNQLWIQQNIRFRLSLWSMVMFWVKKGYSEDKINK